MSRDSQPHFTPSLLITVRTFFICLSLNLISGHSICDSHFGAGKRQLRVDIGAEVLFETSTVLASFNKLKNTEEGNIRNSLFATQSVGQFIECDNTLKLVSDFKLGRKKYFDFFCENAGEIWCREDYTAKWV